MNACEPNRCKVRADTLLDCLCFHTTETIAQDESNVNLLPLKIKMNRLRTGLVFLHAVIVVRLGIGDYIALIRIDRIFQL